MRRFIEAPFPRGQTLNQDSLLTLDATFMDHLVGQLVLFTDMLGKPLVLRIVRADAALTDVGGKTVSYTAGKIGRNVASLCATTGEVSSVIDHEDDDTHTAGYAVTKDIAQYDLFYVVEEGDVMAACESDVDAGDAVMANSSDTVAQATAGAYVIGVANEDDGDTVTGFASIRVGSNLKPSDAATAGG